MTEKTVDRRVRKTKRQLRIALMELMNEKNVNSISVRELAERADINRGTFYIHYKDVADLLQQLEDDIAERMLQLCQKYSSPEYETHDTYPFLTELFRLAKENADLCTVLLGPNSNRAFTERLCRIVYGNFLYNYLGTHFSGTEAQLKYFCSFIVPGFQSTALAWLYTNGEETPEEMANLVGSFVMQGISAFEKHQK